MTNFGVMATRVATELRRSNLTTEVKAAINDAIYEAAQTRFYFNEMRGVSFPTVIGTEYYSDQGLVEIDAIWYMRGTTRENLYLKNNLDADDWAIGNANTGEPITFSRQGQFLRLEPIPNAVYTIYLDGYGRLTPTPLTADANTNAWFTEGERYIRALAKRNVLRDVVKDFGEARVYDAIAEDYKSDLLTETGVRIGTGRIRPTSF